MKKLAFVNGRLVPEEQAAVSIFDYGLLYGYGIFETIRAYNGRFFMLEEHLKRLRHSAEKTGMRINVDGARRAIKSVLAANKIKDGYVRITITYGVGKPRLAFGAGGKPTIIAFAREIPKDVESKQQKGVRIGFSEIMQYSRRYTSGVKSINYLETALRKKEAANRRLDDVIILNEKMDVVEASTANIFLVDGRGSLVTPKLEDGCLEGITRDMIIGIARKLRIKIVEKSISRAELLKAKEVFISNSVMEIIPVVRIEGKNLVIGASTRRLQVEYKRIAR
jgi:branched-chain amino acid aminotransferase